MAAQEGVDGVRNDPKPNYRNPPKYKESPIEDDYVIHWSKHLGTGVSGPVRECTHIKSGQRRALKILRERDKSHSEISLHWKCSDSEYVVRIVEVYSNTIKMPTEIIAQKKLLVVMDLMEGGELFSYIYQNKKFTEELARKIACQIGVAVHDCHKNGIAHRDLKPENLLLVKKMSANDDDLKIKLSDFGFAKIDNGDMKTPQFTPYYVAPQILQAQEIQYSRAQGKLPPGSPYYYDKSCDMWSFGVILYIMLCGYPPFYSEIQGQPLSNRMKMKIMAGQYTFPRESWKAISADAKDLIQKLLSVEPSGRLTISEFFAHPWIKTAQNQEQRLPSPDNFNEEQMELYKEAHAAVLAEIRRGAEDFQLLPTNDMFASNPIAQRRKVKPKIPLTIPMPPIQNAASSDQKIGVVSPMEITLPSPPLQDPHHNPNVYPINAFEQKIRDVIDMCMMPPPPMEDSSGPKLEASGDPDPMSPALISAIRELMRISSSKRDSLVHILAKFAWDGTSFANGISTSHLADALRTLL